MIICGNCIDVMPRLEAESIDMVLADVPYGQTQNTWDVPIPFEPMWSELRRVAKREAAIVLMAAQPFASKLICSNLEDFRYDLIWQKNKPTGFLNAKKQPLRNHEHILVFYRKPPAYFPQMTTGHNPGNYARRTKHSTNYGSQTPTEYGGSTERYPLSIVPMPIINNDDPDKRHPTQKPVDLMAWLIRSYTKRGEIVLDIAAGSGTTAVAALREGRRFVCIEQEPNYVDIAEARVAAERASAPLFMAAQ
jgi:site-specific DNA-methyltransferase (adenine-specific)